VLNGCLLVLFDSELSAGVFQFEVLGFICGGVSVFEPLRDAMEVESEVVGSPLPSLHASDQGGRSNDSPVESGDNLQGQGYSGNFVGSAELDDVVARNFLGDLLLVDLFGLILGGSLFLNCLLSFLSGGFFVVLD
jgi:hypothetical protein